METTANPIPPRRPQQGAQPTFAILLRAGPGCVDPIRSLRGLLKAAKRRFGLICTSAVEVVQKGERVS